MRTAKRPVALALCLALLLALAACAPAAQGPATQGGTRTTYRELYASEVGTFNYLATGNTNDLRMSANCVDCLVEYDSTGNILPALAESWEANADNTVWTFHIRKGVMWVDYQGNEVAEVTANDWVAAAKYSNTAANEASNQYMYDGIVKNAQAYYEYTAALLEDPAAPEVKWEDVGVKAQDDYTLVYTMESPCSYFPSVLSYSSYMPVYEPFLNEMGESFGKATGPDTILYNGAFRMSEFAPQEQRVLVKNDKYWDKDKVYIDRLEFLYNASASTLGPESFLRDEVDYTSLDAALLSAWQADSQKSAMVSPVRPTVSYSYFYCFNFEPRFDASLEPDNWVKAVNNENFRLSILHALDRENALQVQDPVAPKRLLNNTVTPPTFAVAGGKDFTQYDALKSYTAGESFDTAKAADYKAKAVEELTAAGATFPVKVYMRYNPDTANWDKECQLVEQQLEGVLGTDYIDVIVEAGPATGFLGAIRRSGNYGFMKCNWGADYADPQTWTDPFKSGNSYNFMYTNPNKELDGKPCTSKTSDTQALVNEYYALLDAAKAITNDDDARYTAFAQAEAFLIQHGFVVPYSISAGGYVCTRLNVFESQYAPYGLALQRFKGQKVYDDPMTTESFNSQYADWQAKTTGTK